MKEELTDQELEHRLIEAISIADVDYTYTHSTINLEFKSGDEGSRVMYLLQELQHRRASPEAINEFRNATQNWREANQRMNTARKALPAQVAHRLRAEEGRRSTPSHTYPLPTPVLGEARETDSAPDRQADNH